MSMIKMRLKDFLSGYFKDHDFADSEDIFASGYVNSLFVIQLIAMVEKDFSITLEDEDLDFENFRSIDGIERFVVGKQAVTVGT
ncbi:acyl carrier protein [Frankia sp. Cr1]|uniref:acyl carrier protein n=1 Tax=Frankia sp. Cr1 TaxID=3073931 RepID=UPI002AD5285D|nr:phosphopantetheine-binding protein [Frankia sp. Cr1]